MAAALGSHWNCESVRFTYFYAGEPPESLRNELWKQITKVEPESSVRRPAERMTQEQGPFLGGELSISVGLNRIDIVLGSDFAPGVLPSLGLPVDMIDQFRSVILTAGAVDLETCATRVAVGLVCTEQHDSRESAYLRLDDLLEDVRVNKDSRDFSYQVNLPRKSKINADVDINRLTRWNSVAFRVLSVDSAPVDLPDIYAVRLELDFNTGSDTQLPVGVQGQIMQEIVEEIKQILS